MTSSSIGDRVMLLPLSGSDLSVIVSQQLNAALDMLTQDASIVLSVNRSIVSHLIWSVYDSRYVLERWKRPLALYVQKGLSELESHGFTECYDNVKDLSPDATPYERFLVVTRLETTIWQSVVTAEEYISRLVIEYQSGRLFLPPPRPLSRS